MKVKVFSTPTCPWCVKAKEFLKQNNVEFEDINVAENMEAAKEMIEKTGQMGVPVIMIIDDEGKEYIIIGFNEPKIREILKI